MIPPRQPAAALARSVAEDALRRMHEHGTVDGIGGVADLIHPEAEMRLLISAGRLLRGRQAVLDAFADEPNAALYAGRVLRFEWLDGSTALTFGQARYPLAGGGFAEGSVFWLDEVRDGLIRRVEAFKTEAEARETYARRVRPR